MTSISIAVAVAILTFGSGLLGLYLQLRLPRTHLSGGSKDMILAVIGLLTLLLALVLGTLVGNTYAFFAMQKSELETMASRALLVDQALVEYGPEAKPARNLMKQALTQSYDLFWRGGDADPTQLKVEVALDRWEPHRERARRARSQDAGSEGCARCGQSQSCADGANPTLDVPAAVEPGRLVAGDQRDPLVDVPLLRLWGSLGDQSDNYRRAGARRDFGGERNVPDPRSNSVGCVTVS